MDMLEIFGKLFKKTDLFSKPIQLTIDKKPSYKTVAGGVISVIVLILIIVITGFYMSDVITHRNPTFFVEASVLDFFPFTTLNNSNFFGGVRIEDDSSNVLDPSFYEIFAYYDEYIYTNSSNRDVYQHYTTKLAMKNCTTSHFQPRNLSAEDGQLKYEKLPQDFFEKENLNTFRCINFDNRVVGGDWSDTKINYFTYYVKKCDNKTEKLYNVKCRDESEYQEKAFYIGFKVLNYQIRPSHFEDAVKVGFFYSYVSFDNDFSKLVSIYFSNSTFDSDDQYILGDHNITNVLTFEQFKVDTRKKSVRVEEDGKTPTVVELPLYLTRNYKNYFRSYMRIQDVLGIVSGFLSMFVYFISIFYNFYLSITYKYYLYDSILDFRIDEAKDTSSMEKLMAEDYDKFIKSPNMAANKSSMSLGENLGSKEIIQLKQLEQDKVELVSLQQREVEFKEIHNGIEPTNIINPSEKVEDVLFLNKKVTNENKAPLKRSSLNKYNDINDVNESNDEKLSVKSSISDVKSINDETEGEKKRRLSQIELSKRQTRLLQIITSFKKKREALKNITITRVDYLCYKYFYCIKKKTDDHHKEKKQIIKLSELEMFRRMDLLNLMKHLDQISLFEKSLLNKHQIFMLENKSKQVVYNRFADDIESGAQEEKEEKISQLIDYIKKRKETKMLSKVDYVFLENVDQEIKQQVLNEVDVESF